MAAYSFMLDLKVEVLIFISRIQEKKVFPGVFLAIKLVPLGPGICIPESTRKLSEKECFVFTEREANEQGTWNADEISILLQNLLSS